MNALWATIFAAVTFIAIWAIAVALLYRRLRNYALSRAATAEKAYAELTAQSGIRERTLLHELKTCVAQRDDFHDRWKSVLEQWKREVALSESLSATVRQYAKDIRETMVLMKDETAPKELVAAEEALRLHDEQVKLRSQT